jgi:hypothetical protein
METTVRDSRRQGNCARRARGSACHSGADVPNIRYTTTTVRAAKNAICRRPVRFRFLLSRLRSRSTRLKRLRITGTMPN